ncbi:DUF1254 domain-containing protein [Agrobacterium sp. S2]|nr:DUF1254 domain-containing protein [Agrobacterium sp. S2]
MHVKDTVIRGTAQTAPACLAILLSAATLFAADYRMTTPRTLFYYAATINTPAMAVAMPGVGSQYAAANLDSEGNPFNGGKTYVLHVPANVPAKDFWSVVIYDTQTRSMLQTDQPFPSLSSEKDLKRNPDGSTDIVFAPERPADSPNWIQTIPGKSWFTIFRLYGPLTRWFDKTWKLEDIAAAR